MEASKKLTPYQDINELLAFWADKLKNLLSDNLVGLYLTGSLTYGDFVLERSDIDLLAVVKSPLSENILKSLEQLHKEIEQLYPKWAERVECSYLPIDLLPNILPPKTPRPYLGGGKFYPDAPYGNEWIINQYFLYKYGVALTGADFKTLVKPIEINDVQEASVRDLFKEWEPKITDVDWLANSHYQSYLVLNLCRILYTVIAGDAGSKKVSAEWVKNKYPQWKDLVETAEGWHYGVEMKRQNDAINFIKFTIEAVKGKTTVY